MKRSAAFFPYSYSYSDSERRCPNPGTEKVQEISRDAGIMVGHCHHKFHCLAVCNGLVHLVCRDSWWPKALMGCLPRVPWSTGFCMPARIGAHPQNHTKLSTWKWLADVYRTPPTPIPLQSWIFSSSLKNSFCPGTWSWFFSTFCRVVWVKKSRNWFHASVKF